MLGVAFVTGTFVYSDTTRGAFDRIFSDAYDGIDLVVSGDGPVGDGRGVYFDDALPDRVARVDGVAAAYATLEATGVQIIADGASLGSGPRGQLGVYLPSDPAARLGVRITAGRAPSSAGEVVIDTGSAERGSVRLGDSIDIVTPTTPAEPFTIVGIAAFGDDDDLGGATLAGFDLVTAQRLFGHRDHVDGVLILAAEGVDTNQLADRIGAFLPDRSKIRTGAAAADERAAELHDRLAFVYGFLRVLAFISLFVGTFVIHNTFRVVLAQRTRELALLRAVGATRLQVMGAVLVESTLVGLLSSAVGALMGVAVASLLRRGLSMVGVDLPADGLVVAPRTVTVALVVGTGVTVVSTLLPALAASRVPPLAAMRPDGAARTGRGMRLRLLGGLLLVVTGAVGLVIGAAGGLDGATQRLALVGPASSLLVIGCLVLGAPLAPVVTRLVGAPVARLVGLGGLLAQRNAGRNPRRTSATVAAIAIATALVATATVMASSFRAAVDEVLDQGVEADFVATPDDPFSLQGFSSQLADAVVALDEFDSATRLQFGLAVVDGSEEMIGGVDGSFQEFLSLDEIAGNLDLAESDAFVISGPGETPPQLGERIGIVFEQGTAETFAVAATARGRALTGTFISRSAFDRHAAAAGTDRQVFFGLAPDVTESQATVALASVSKDFPTVTIQTLDELKSDAEEQITQLLGLVTGLLALTVLIGLVGVANTMTLSVHERAGEIGLLRAVGLSRRETRRMIRAEASIITV